MMGLMLKMVFAWFAILNVQLVWELQLIAYLVLQVNFFIKVDAGTFVQSFLFLINLDKSVLINVLKDFIKYHKASAQNVHRNVPLALEIIKIVHLVFKVFSQLMVPVLLNAIIISFNSEDSVFLAQLVV
jgi:hypothetical protein